MRFAFVLGGVGLSGCVSVCVNCGVWMHGMFLLAYEVVGMSLVVWGVNLGGVVVVEWFSYLRVCD